MEPNTRLSTKSVWRMLSAGFVRVLDRLLQTEGDAVDSVSPNGSFSWTILDMGGAGTTLHRTMKRRYDIWQP
jgi:hypothetical protein